MIDPSMFSLRHSFMRSLRNFFDNQGFIEIETPFLIKANTPDPHIDPIHVHTRFPSEDHFQLRTSPEIWLKKALALGLSNVYELARVFRDDPKGRAHSKEFTMLEWYRSHADLRDLIKDCTQIFNLAAKTPEFLEVDLKDLWRDLASLDLDQILDQHHQGDHLYLQKMLARQGDHMSQDSDFIDAFFLVMIKYIEPQLPFDRPVVICRWPLELAALAASCDDDARYCQRFEIYYRGLEIANAYQECVDSFELLDRFNKENYQRKRLDKPVFPIDYDFLEATSRMPKTAGIALGVDRLLMASLEKDHLAELILGL